MYILVAIASQWMIHALSIAVNPEHAEDFKILLLIIQFASITNALVATHREDKLKTFL